MPFAATWMDLEIVILSKMSDREEEVSYNIPYIWNLKRNDTHEFIHNTEKDSQTQRMNLWLPGGRMEGRDSQGIWARHVHTAMFKMDNL